MKKYTQGMTLIEVLITMALMGGFMVVMFSLQTILTRQFALTDKQNQSFLEARAIIAKMRVEYNKRHILSGSDYKVSSFTQTDMSSGAMRRLRVSFILNNETYEALFEEVL